MGVEGDVHGRVRPMIELADGLLLEDDYITKVCAIVAQRRKGKTYTAHLIAEDLVAAGLPWVALDPTGAWWGLGSSADGLAPGLPVVVLGGAHGHVPLGPHMGRMVADLVLDHPGWYVIDLSGFDTRGDERRFSYEFADRLYRRKGQPGMDWPLHLFVDEADMFAPQEKETGDLKMLGAFQAIVRRGGLRGLGVTLITQRPALLNKSVLTQLDMLILLRLVAGNDQDAIDANYIKRQASKELRAELMGSMAGLAIGEGWVWEPGADPTLLARTRFRLRRTFNSSATPKPGEVRIEPSVFADVDLDTLMAAFEEEIVKADSEDPAKLRAKIAELEGQLAGRPPERVEVPVLDEELVVRLETALQPAAGLLAEVQERLTWEVAQRGEVLAFERRLDDRQGVPRARPPGRGRAEGNVGRPAAAGERGGVAVQATPDERAEERPGPPARRDARRAAVPGPAVDLPEGEAKILTAAAQHERGVTREQASILTGYKRSTRDAYIRRLQNRGLVTVDGGLVVATDAGVAALGDDFEPLPTGAALREHWLAVLPEGEARILAQLVAAYPGSVPRDVLSEVTGYKRSTRDAYIRRLQVRKLVVVAGGEPCAAGELFD